MADLRSRLERIGERVRVAPGAFERLEGARRRYERNRRIAAGAVALLVAVAGTFIAFSAFRSGDGVRTVVSGGSNEAPVDVAEFSCDGSGSISPSSSLVDAQPDGVHVAVTNTADAPVSFSVASLDPQRHVVGGDGADPGERKETIWQLPPGDATVSCGPVSDGGQEPPNTASLQVLDPADTYRSPNMTCAASSEVSDYAEGAVGVQGDPVEIARQHLSGLEFDDLVERAGYPESVPPVLRVVRGGDVVASAAFTSDGQGGWLLETLNLCIGVPIAWSVESTGVSGPMGQPTNAWDAVCSAARAGEGNNVHVGPDLHVDGRDIDFDTSCLIAPAGKPLTILFSNLDAGVQRNISIYPLTPYLRVCLVTGTAPASSDALGHPLFTGELITGVGEIVYDLGRFEAGEYYFQDDVHPGANGVVVVE